MPRSWPARLYITLVSLAGVATLALGAQQSRISDMNGFLALLALAVITSRLKVKLPGMKASMSVNLPFLLLASAQIELLPTLLIAGAATAVQCFARKLSPEKLVQIAFNVSAVLLAITAAFGVQHRVHLTGFAGAALLVLGAATYLLVNTGLVSGIVCLTGEQPLVRTWTGIFTLTYLYYAMSAGVVAVTMSIGANLGVLLVSLAVVYGAYRSFQLYFVAMSGMPEATAVGARD